MSNLDQFAFADPGTGSTGIDPGSAIFHEFRPKGKQAALRGFHFVYRTSVCRQKMALSIQRLLEADDVFEADQVLTFEGLRREMQESSYPGDVGFRNIDVPACLATPGTSALAGEPHALHRIQNCTIRSVSTPNAEKAPLEWEQARAVVLATVRRQERASEQVDLSSAHGRVLAEPCRADRDYPALRRSLRDGFAVKASEVPGTLVIRGEVRAGESEQAPLATGEALEIMTGAPVPGEADAVVMVEHVQRLADHVRIERTAEAGQFINEQGSEARAGSVLIPAGTRLDASHIATLAMTGSGTIPVFRKPRVAILATGDEIVDLQAAPAPHQIRNSNSYMLTALVSASGAIPEILPVARDTPEALRPLLERGSKADMLLISGGVSAGRYDLVKPTLRELGVQFHFERVRIQPGGPLAFGTLQDRPVFGLPGNPGSTLVTFQLFAQAAVALLGGEQTPDLPLLTARFNAPFRHRLGLTRFLPALLSSNGAELSHIPWQGSSDVPALSKANAFLVAPHDRETWNVGDEIRVMRKL